MNKDKAQKAIRRIFEEYAGAFSLHFEDWDGTGEDDLCVTVNHNQGDYVTHLYLTGEDDDVFLYIGDDVIEPLTEANVWRVLGFDAMHSAEVLADTIESLEAEVERLRGENAKQETELSILRDFALRDFAVAYQSYYIVRNDNNRRSLSRAVDRWHEWGDSLPSGD